MMIKNNVMKTVITKMKELRKSEMQSIFGGGYVKQGYRDKNGKLCWRWIRVNRKVEK